jgi:hypothetical protein
VGDLEGTPQPARRLEVEPARFRDHLARAHRAVDLAETGEVEADLAQRDVMQLTPDAPVASARARAPQLILVELRRCGQEPRGRPLVIVDQRADREGERHGAVHDQTFGTSMLTADRERRGGMRTDRRKLHQVTDTGRLRRLEEARFPLLQPLVGGR